MKTLGNLLLTATALALLAAIWAPGAWWQWLATALILLIAGAGVSVSADKARFARGGVIPVDEHDAREGLQGFPLDSHPRSGRTYGRKADQ